MLEVFGEGRLEDVAQVAREFGREANADMGFKAVWWLAALAGEHNKYDGGVWDYQPVWGTGCGLVELTPNPRKELDFEKECDEGRALATTEVPEQGTGLETHNVLPEQPRPEPDEPPLPEWLAPSAAETAAALPVAPRDASPPAQVPRFARDDNAIRTEKAPPPVGPYPHARRVGELLFLS